MWDRGWGEYGKANFFPLAEPGYPQGEEELGLTLSEPLSRVSVGPRRWEQVG